MGQAMANSTTPENSLMAMIVQRCGLDEAATQVLHRIESAAWDFVAGEPSEEALRHVLAAIGVLVPTTGEAAPRAARRLLSVHARARVAGVPADVLASFTEDALRMALLLRDAFERGYQLGRVQAPTASPMARTVAAPRTLPH